MVYHLPGPSFREHLNIQGIGRFKPFTLQQIFQDHPALAGDVVKEIKPFQDEKVVEVYRLGDGGTYRRIGAFGPEDTVTAEAVGELPVSLAKVFAETE